MKRSLEGLILLTFLLLSVPSLLPVSRAQEEKKTPSQKTKEAVEKFKKAPAAVGKSLKALKETGKARLQKTFRGKRPAPAKVEADLTLPTKKPKQPERRRYSSAGRRDPFRPLGLKTKVSRRRRANLSPLERYDLGQLKLVGIVWDIKEPIAMVEDTAGLGYIVKVGTPIGANEGKVKAIEPTEVVIEESYIDFYGARKDREVSMRLPKE